MPSSRRTFLKYSMATMAAMTSAPARSTPAASPSKKLLILGGTSFLGPALVAAARARGHTLTLFNRGKTNPHRFPDLETLIGDRDGKLDALRGRRWDAVVDTSGYVPRHVMDSATLLAGAVAHYVFISTVSVYADVSRPVDEGAPLAKLKAPTEEVGNGSYGALKALCEQAAEQAMPGRVTVVRPGLIVGPDDPSDRFTYWPVRLARGGEVLAPGDRSDPVLYIDVRDLARWLIGLVERGLMGTFNALGPAGTLTVGELLDGCRRGVDQLGAPRAPAAVASGAPSAGAARSASSAPSASGDVRFTWVDAGFLEAHGVHPWSDLPVWVPPVGEGAYMGRISRARAVAAGLTFRPLAETARDTLAWWRTLPPERQAKPRAGISAAREAEVLAAWHARAATKG
jgi:2'-hydroxyisoflavone reductase